MTLSEASSCRHCEGNSGNRGNRSNSGNSGNRGNSGNSGNRGNSGNSAFRTPATACLSKEFHRVCRSTQGAPTPHLCVRERLALLDWPCRRGSKIVLLTAGSAGERKKERKQRKWKGSTACTYVRPCIRIAFALVIKGTHQGTDWTSVTRQTQQHVHCWKLHTAATCYCPAVSGRYTFV